MSTSLYWSRKGQFAPQFARLFAAVPRTGSAATTPAELVRCVGRLQYERFNNGNCNRSVIALQECATTLKKYRRSARKLVAESSVFSFTPAEFGDACDDILAFRGGANGYAKEADCVCDGFIALAAVLAGESLTPSEEEQAFLSAIDSKPKDRTVRLVYADWLEELPRGYTERAALVRKFTEFLTA